MRSFLTRPSTGTAALILLLVIAAVLMFQASFSESAIMDELAHIPAGYGYVHALDDRLNPEHPPLVKALAAMPLLLLQPDFPTNDPAWQGVNGQWDMGAALLYGAGNDADRLIRAARVVPIFLTLFLAGFIYFWSRKRIGSLWALVPSCLFALSPTVLAHGHYVTTDIGAALGVTVASYFFIRSLEEPSWKTLAYAGVAFGVAELLKFSTVLLIPLFIFLAATHYFFLDRKNGAGKIGRLIAVFAIGYLAVVYPVYALFGAHYPPAKQVSDTAAILGGLATQNCAGLVTCAAKIDLAMAGHALTRPVAEYLLGVIMVIQRSDGGNTAYFLGQVSATGSHWYFPVVYFLKESIPALVIIFLGLWAAIVNTLRSFRRGKKTAIFRHWLGDHFTEFALLSFVALYWAYSMKSTLNIGVRHILPTLPFIYMLAAAGWKGWASRVAREETGSSFGAFTGLMKTFLNSALKISLLLALLFWNAGETLAAAPYYLSYFNELGGGTMHGYKYVADSNYDWGQDLLRLKAFVDSRPEIERVAVDYFGGGNPAYYLGGKQATWHSAMGDPRAKDIHWLAVSVNTLGQAVASPAPGFIRKLEDEYRWLAEERIFEDGLPKPDYRAGTSIFIYYLP